MKYVKGLLIRGLSYNSSSTATLFVDDGTLAASSLPTLGPLSSSVQVVASLLSIQGPTWASSLRDPAGLGGTPVATLADDEAGTLAKLFAPDPGFQNTDRWEVQNLPRVEANVTSLQLKGDTAPTDGQILYLGSEALEVDGTPSLLSGTHDVWVTTVIRGACGSHAKAWALNPKAYPPGDDGSRETLVVTSRPDFDDALFEAALYHFRMDPNDPGAVAAVEWVWYGHITSRPQGELYPPRWKVGVTHVSKQIKDWRFPGAKDIETTYNFVVTKETKVLAGIASAGFGGNTLAFRRLPASVRIQLPVLEVERLFNFPIHVPGDGKANVTQRAALNSRLLQDQRVTWELFAEAGGHKWVWKVTAVAQAPTFGDVIVYGDLVASSDGASIDDSPADFPAGEGFTQTRNEGLNQNFIRNSLLDSRVRTAQGETPPKVTIRLRLRMSFAEAFLTIALSGQGGKANHATYDLLPGGWGLQLDPDWLSIGSTPSDPLTVDEGTTSWLELAALLDEEYDYALLPEDKFGAWLKNELLLHTATTGYVPSTGGYAARLLARTRPVSPPAIVEIAGPAVKVDERIDPLKVLILERGIHPVTLEPRYRKPLQLPEARAKDAKEAQVIRVWKEGGAFTDQELATGPFARLARFFFGSAQGRPPLWEITTSIGQGSFTFGDMLTWTNADALTAAGRGVTMKVICIAPIRRLEDGRWILRVMEDVVNASATVNASEGLLAPALKVTGIVDQVSATRFVLEVAPLHSSSPWDITTSSGGIYQTLASANARVRISTPKAHNPSAANERLGLLEASGTVHSVAHHGKRRNWIEVSFSSNWNRGGKTLAADICILGAVIHLQDFVPAELNPEAVALQGHANQGASGRDYLRWVRPGRALGHRSLISS